MSSITNRGAIPLIAKREPFVTGGGNIKGTHFPPSAEAGWLRGDDRDLYNMHRSSHMIEYVVLSYDTPMAWYADGQWFMPDTKYSATTSKHQGIIRQGIL